MTSVEVETAARQQYNAVGDTNWSQSEIMSLIYAACLDMARKSFIIEDVFSSSTVASQQEYSYPTNVISIKRVTYAGAKLEKISFKEDDYLTGQNQATTATGTPTHYAEFNNTIYLRPTPSAVGTLKVFAFVEPQAVTTTSTLEIPTLFHMDLVDFVLSRMYAKDKDFNSAQYFQGLWADHIMEAKKYVKRRYKGDAFAAVQDEEQLGQVGVGYIR
jgi:hypothetical protein